MGVVTGAVGVVTGAVGVVTGAVGVVTDAVGVVTGAVGVGCVIAAPSKEGKGLLHRPEEATFNHDFKSSLEF